MSAPTATLRALPLETKPLGPSETRGLRVFYWSIAIPACLLLAWSVASSVPDLGQTWPTIVVWIGTVAVAELMSVPVYGTVVLTMALPVVLASAMVFSPEITAPIAFLGFVDTREFKREISIGRGLYNRSQVMLSAVAASIVFHRLGGDLRVWPSVIPVAILALSTDWLINSALVAIPTRLLTRQRFGEVMRRIFGDRPADDAVGYVCLALLAIPLAATYLAVGLWGLLAFLFPLFIARQMFAHGRRLDEATEMVSRKDEALAASLQQVADERRDERRFVAGGLHDDVLQPLYKVHLMGQVLRQDLEAGRLLDLDTDLPELVSATNAAQAALRGLIKGLRQSAIGPGGLVATLQLLVRDVAPQTPATIHLRAEDEIRASATSQFLAYQVAREALTNAVRHAEAREINILLSMRDGDIVVVVADNGKGFRIEGVDRAEHFGLQLLFERVKAGGGDISVRSLPGSGTRLAATVPADGPWQI